VSKVDAQRALRDARYAAYAAKRKAASAPTPVPGPVQATPKASDDVETVVVPPEPAPASPASAAPTAPASPAAPAAPAASEDPDAEVQLCGHRNIGNKTCQRPAGHPEKNHRYK
jgi:hypothetical protein